MVRHSGSTTTTVGAVTTTSCTDATPLPGPVTYGVVARIGADWRGPESPVTSFTYDQTAPVTTMTTSPTSANAAGWFHQVVSVTLTASDPGGALASGVSAIHYRLDGGAETVVSGSTATLTLSQDAVHSLTYWAVDNNGNTESPVHAATVKIDTTPPVSTISPPSSSSWVTSGTITLAATDATSGVASIQYAVDGASSYTTYSGPFALPDGTHTIAYHATDVAGNVEADHTATIKIDTTPPGVSASPGSGSVTDSVTLTATDATSGVAAIQYQLDGATAWTQVPGSSATVTWAAQSGVHTLVYRAVDNAGNVSGPVTATYTSTLVTTVVSCGTTGKKVVHVSWTPVAGATSYNLYFNTTSHLGANVAATQTTYSLTSTNDAGTFSVEAVVGGLSTPMSNTVTYSVGNGSGTGTCTAN